MASDPPPVRARRRLGVGAAIVVVLLAFAITVGIGVLRGAAAPTEEISASTPTTAVTGEASDDVFIHVAGAVRAPGLYRLRADARVVDAIAAAGGFADDADRTVLNLARTVSDGEQIVAAAVGAVAPPGEPGSSEGGGAGGGAGGGGGDGRVNLNTADASALDTLPRIGPAMAQRILDWREENGRFTSVDDLLAVPGIGDKMLEALRDLVSV